MTVQNPYWFGNLMYFSQIPTLLGLTGLHNSLGPLLSSRLRSDCLPQEHRYSLDCGRIASTRNAGILWIGIPCSSIYHCSSHQITSALDATNELVHRVNLFVVVLLMSQCVGVFEFYVFCLFICIFTFCFVYFGFFFICIFYILLHFKLIIVKQIYVFNLVQFNLI